MARLDGTPGNDVLNGTSSDDTLNGFAGNDALSGGDGRDLLDGGPGDDVLDGGAGLFDYAYYTNATTGANINLRNGTASDGTGGTDSVAGIELVYGSSHNDTITGDANGNTLNGGSGNDWLDGDAGDDNLWGNAGNDTLVGGAGDRDAANYFFANRGIQINLATGTGADGEGGTDTLVDIESVQGSAFGDTIMGNTNANSLTGGSGNDTLDGGAGNDSLSGDEGSDTLLGGEGNDRLTGGNGTDSLDGGGGIDLALFVGAKSTYSVVANVQLGSASSVSSSTEGTDTLVSIERLAFSDTKLAYDIGSGPAWGNAGSAALLTAALLGKAGLANKAAVGAVLGVLDAGVTLAQACDLSVSTGLINTLAGGSDTTSFSKLLLRNLTGSDTDATLVATLSGLVDSGAYTRGALINAAAVLGLNQANINLTGLAITGLEYL